MTKNEFIDESEVSEDKLFDSEGGLEEYGLIKPVHLLRFAKWILGVISIIYLLSGLSELIYPDNKFFETCKVTLPSLATLVMGYYFGTSK